MGSRSTISDFTILPITVPALPSFPQTTTHTLYLRPHSPKIPTEDDARSLFVVNVPVDATAEHFRSIFKVLVGAGKFEHVSFDSNRKTLTSAEGANIKAGQKRKRATDGTEQDAEEGRLPRTWDRDLHRSGSSAVVLFVDRRSAEVVIKAIRKLHKQQAKQARDAVTTESIWPIWGQGIEFSKNSVPPLGSARYKAHHTLLFPAPRALQAGVDVFMSAFNRREAAVLAHDKKRRNEPDADGFITVSKGARAGVVRKEAAELKAKEMAEREEGRRMEAEHRGFYRFQGREKRKEEMERLRMEFESDRKRVEEMRGRRGKYRPEK